MIIQMSLKYLITVTKFVPNREHKLLSIRKTNRWILPTEKWLFFCKYNTKHINILWTKFRYPMLNVVLSVVTTRL
jgi:hypothetical protein